MTNAGGCSASGKRSSHGQGKPNRLNSTSKMAATVTGSGRREPIVGPLLFPSGVLPSHDAIREGPAHLTKVYALGCPEDYSRKVTYLQWVALGSLLQDRSIPVRLSFRQFIAYLQE